jgi:hypothetical protein
MRRSQPIPPGTSRRDSTFPREIDRVNHCVTRSIGVGLMSNRDDVATTVSPSEALGTGE